MSFVTVLPLLGCKILIAVIVFEMSATTLLFPDQFIILRKNYADTALKILAPPKMVAQISHIIVFYDCYETNQNEVSRSVKHFYSKSVLLIQQFLLHHVQQSCPTVKILGGLTKSAAQQNESAAQLMKSAAQRF